ncbi:MAG TPA: hypothetical protein VHR15_20725 [Ktedonobacterales bacterium]|jgi:hypothetical protein|nr:hypothetical protein [Ktedonobacterales bacterium]
MLYQVLTRKSSVAEWSCVTPPTSDMSSARRHLQTLRRYNAGAILVAAENLAELAQLTRRLREVGDEVVWSRASAQPPPMGAPAASPRQRDDTVDRRWQLERGPGGDHDEPYSFVAPTSEATRRAWARLLARVQRERRGGV